jgi:signal transduction histidine kinase
MGRMPASRKLAVAAFAIFILAVAAVTCFAPRGFAIVAFGDIFGLVVLLLGSVAMLQNAIAQPRHRAFWALLSAGCFLWAFNQAGWTWVEVILRRDLPDPFIGDVILFVHVVPFMAAVALRPHRPLKDRKVGLDALNFLMLLVWWVFLYMFIVFPDEYVQLNIHVYSKNYDLLYLLENLVLVFALGMVASSTPGNWRKVYWNLFIACSIYTLGSEMINVAISRNQYYSGGPYDALLLVAMGWMLWTALLARRIDLAPSPDDEPASRWIGFAPRLTMAAILSLPVLGLWTLFTDHGPARLRNFRLLVTLAATLVLGLFVFLKQFLLDRQLIALLDQSRQSYENLQRLQSQLVQKEKLASLGQLIAGAAHEINNPLAAILGYSELLAAYKPEGEQAAVAEKIGQQARRTRDLVADLLSFSQQNPSEKVLVDVGGLLQRALQMHETDAHNRNIRIEPVFAAPLPRIWGNTNQLLQAFIHLTENAMDALSEVGGGVLRVKAVQENSASLNSGPVNSGSSNSGSLYAGSVNYGPVNSSHGSSSPKSSSLETTGTQNSEIVVEFSDSGPGMADPQKVFDPFYTTKPIGKGTGLGLSVTYGIVQDHHGQITCQNKPEGGAVFTLRFPVASQAASAVHAGRS